MDDEVKGKIPKRFSLEKDEAMRDKGKVTGTALESL
jgi:hypothetical protein